MDEVRNRRPWHILAYMALRPSLMSTGHDRAWGCHTDPVESMFSTLFIGICLYFECICIYVYNIYIYNIYNVLCTSRCLYVFVMCRPKGCSCTIWRPGCCMMLLEFPIFTKPWSKRCSSNRPSP